MRYTSYRAINTHNGSCLTLDVLALMAGITLLLAHLDSHLSNRSNPSVLRSINASATARC